MTFSFGAGKRITRRLALILGLSALAACAPSMRAEKSPGSFAWFDLVTTQPQAAQSFYSQLFGWRFEDSPSERVDVITNGRRLVGGLVTAEEGNGSRWKPVLSVSETETAVAIAKGKGGKLIDPIVPTTRGTLAAITDPTGAPLTLYDGDEGIPLGSSPRDGEWVWADLLTPDTNSAKAFYRALVGFDTRLEERPGLDRFEIFTLADHDRGGLIKVTRKQANPGWLPYIQVADLDQTLARAQELGGTVAVRQDDVAVLQDPTGAAIGVAQRSGDE